jgi:glucose/arabinose dehydrogenase
LSDISKMLRLNDDGSIPGNNPFVAREGYLPEIWSIGHRAIEGMDFHPVTGELWASEHGPQGGDEVNIIEPGENYGWPVVSYGRDYDGSRVSPQPWQAGMLQPEIFWVPSIATSGLMFYTGDKFPQWENDLFVGSLMMARVAGTGHVERINFNGECKKESSEATRERQSRASPRNRTSRLLIRQSRRLERRSGQLSVDLKRRR